MGIYKKYWWKILCVILLYYTLIGGLLFDVPRIPILHETIRNQFFHVPIWSSENHAGESCLYQSNIE